MAPLPTLRSPGHYQVTNVPLLSNAAGAGGAASSGSGGVSANGGAASVMPGSVCAPVLPPGNPPTVASCGDGFRTSFEQCDDGNLLDGDGCGADCRSTPALIASRGTPSNALPLPGRELGLSRHPSAVGCNSVGVSFIDRSSEPAALKLGLFSSVGVPGGVLEYGAATVDLAAPAVAALPDDTFAVAWTDFDGDGDELGIRLRKLDPTLLVQAPSVFANLGRPFSQRAPDVVFDGNELVVAWVDDADPISGPDLRYRLFDRELRPKSEDLTLAATGAVEQDVALAAFQGAWAAAWRSGSGGFETIEVQSGGSHWSVGPFLPGGVNDRPALEFIDASHLALAFTEGTDPTASGSANTPRLYAAVLDAAYPGPTLAIPVAPTVEPYASSPTLSQTEPALARFDDRLLLAWRSSAVSGDAQGDELWSREVKWASGPDNTVLIDVSSVDLPLLGSATLRKGDQGTPALLSSSAWPERRVVTVWQDFGETFGAVSGAPDVALQFSQSPTTDAAVARFELSADHNYYRVNALRRGPQFPAAAVTATYASGAKAGLPPQNMFDGSDASFRWTTPTTPTPPFINGPNPAATVTATIDLGRVVTVGAMRQIFDLARTPLSFQVRAAEAAGQWTTVVALMPSSNPDTIVEFAATPARYVEVTWIGTPAFGQIDLQELILFPSASGPVPSSADGYDLTYLPAITASIAGGLSGGGTQFLFDQAATGYLGRSLAQGGTSDGVITVDLGGWFAISEVDLGFRLGVTWAAGGSIEVAANPNNWTKVYDSGRGNVFGVPTMIGSKRFSFATQTARYVRVTDYFITGQGTSLARLDEIQVF